MNKEFVDNVSKIFTALNVRLERIIGNESVAGKRPMDYEATEQAIEGFKQSTKEYQRIQRQTDENFNRVFKAINVNIKNINGLRNIVFKSMDRKVENLDTISRENIAAQEYKDAGVEYDPRTERFHEIAGENKNRMVGETEVRQRVADLRNNQIIEEQKPDAEKVTEVSDNPILGNINSNLMTINEMLKAFLSNISELLVKKEEEKAKPEDIEKPKLLHARKIRDQKKSSGFFDFIISALSLITIGYLPAIIDWFKSFDGDFTAMFNDIKKRFGPMAEKIIKQAGEIISKSSEKIVEFLRPIISDIGELIWTRLSTSIGDWLDKQKNIFNQTVVNPAKIWFSEKFGITFDSNEINRLEDVRDKAGAQVGNIENKFMQISGESTRSIGTEDKLEQFLNKGKKLPPGVARRKGLDFKQFTDEEKNELRKLFKQRKEAQTVLDTREKELDKGKSADKLAEEYIKYLQENSQFTDRALYSKEIFYTGMDNNPQVQIKARKDDGQEITENFVLDPIGNDEYRLKMTSIEIDGKTNTSNFSASKFSKFQDNQSIQQTDIKPKQSFLSQPISLPEPKGSGEQLNKESKESQNDDNSLLDFFKNLLKPIGNSLEIPNANQMPRQKAIIPKVIPNVQAPVDDVFWGVP